MRHTPLVSVVIIFFNSARFLEEAIASVLSQTYQNWELLLVDDGSTDDCPAIAKRYARSHPERIKYLQHANHANLGMSASRNLGARAGSGLYIAFLDSDDTWLPDYLSFYVKILEKNPSVSMTYGYLQWWYSWTTHPQSSQTDFIEPKKGVPADKIIAPPSALIALLARKATASPHVLVRRTTFEAIAGFEERFPNVFEDQVFWSKIAARYHIYVSSHCHYRWRQHPNQFHVTEGPQYDEMWPAYLRWLDSYLDVAESRDIRLKFAIFQARLRLPIKHAAKSTKRMILKKFRLKRDRQM